jgi:CubicO group peptidase (beta-lactamase class C family)
MLHAVLLLVAAGLCCAHRAEAQDAAPGPVEVPAPADVHWLEAPPPSARALAEHPEDHAALLEEQGLVLDLEQRSVSARGGTLHDTESLGYPIEYVLVTDRGRTHEALLVMNARPSVLDACLRAVGLAPGAPMRFRMREEPGEPPAPGDADARPGDDAGGDAGDASGGEAADGADGDPHAADAGDAAADAPEWDAVPASGPLVSIEVAWTDDTGRPHRVSLESLLTDVRTGEALPERDWVYVGGRYGPLRQGREIVQVHVADLNGNVVAIYLDGQGLCLFERNSLEGVDDSLYTIHPGNAPKRGTPVTIIFTATGGHVAPPPPTRDDVLEGPLAEALDGLLLEAQAGGFGGVVQVEQGGRTLLRKAYGSLAPGGAPMPTDAVFPVGPVGRRLIVAAALAAAEGGAFSLDDLLARHVRDVPPDKAGVRLRHLLEDTSGYPARVEGADTIDRARALAALLAEPLVEAPGERCLPSEAGYALLLIALEEAAEDVWRGLLGERVLLPARMVDTGQWGEPRWDGSRLARGATVRDGRRLDAGTPAERLPTWLEQGAGAIVTSVRDLVRFERALARGALPVAAAAFAPACAPADGAWRVDDGEGGPCLVLAGRRGGFACELRHWREADLLLVLASNVEAPDVVPALVERLDVAAAAAREADAGVPPR